MRSLLVVSLFLLVSCASEDASISVEIGPTAIPRGDAIAANDITINNGLFAVAFAVDTAPPWGVARGGIVDISIIRDGELDYDIASLADFMPNNWSSWPTTYQRVTIEKQTIDEVVVKTERDWGEVKLTTRFHIKAADSKIRIATTMTNKGKVALDGLLSGYVVWPDGGNLIADPVVTGNRGRNGANGWTAAYDAGWVVGLHAPFSEVADRLGRDRYTLHDLAPGQTKKLEAWLQIEGDGSLAPMVQSEIEFGQLKTGELRGSVVSTDGVAVDRPAIVISKNGKPIVWTVGNGGAYQIRLPIGAYGIYATAGGYGRSESRKIVVTEGGDSTVDFDDVRPPGRIHLEVEEAGTGRALDARISIEEGQKPLIAYFGRDVYFTDLGSVGNLETDIPPGRYVLKVSAGGGFTSLPQLVNVTVKPGQSHSLKIDVPVLANPQERGWYSADMHHHSDVLDGFTEAEFVLRSELAAGVDVAFLSDHDSVINNEEMHRLSHSRGVPFIPATELSPSWGHFNAYPVDDGKSVEIDTGQAPVQEIFAEARRLGADVVAVNHPYTEYGYFTNLEKGVAPGGFDAGFDLIEISPVLQTSGQPFPNEETVARAWQIWNDGTRKYLVAGSDVHDVWNFRSARARTYAHIEGDLTGDKFIASLQSGHSYASQGPLVFPEILFGSDLSLAMGETLDLEYSVQAVTGLKSVKMIERGREIYELSMAGEANPVAVSFTVNPAEDTWYSLVVEDIGGKIAYTNPVWVSIASDSAN
jgi:hypothetical protein